MSGSTPPTFANSPRSRISPAAFRSIFAVSSVARAATAISPSRHSCGAPLGSQLPGTFGRVSSNAVRSTAPSAAARAYARPIALPAASASVRML